MSPPLFKLLTNFGLFLVILSLTTATPIPSSNPTNVTTLDRLLGYDDEIENSNGDIVIVAGLKGSGKSTMIKFLTTNTTTMESYPSTRNDRFLIRTVATSSDATSTESTAQTSELLTLDTRTNTIFVELPSPREPNRPQETEEILDALTLYKILGHAKRVKLILVVSQSSFVDENNNDFKNLLNHVTRLIMEPTKFRRGVSLIVTKVASPDYSDDVVKSSITNFLENFLQSHNHIIGRPLAEGLLDDGKIGLFRQPQVAGLLSTIPSVQVSQTNLQNMVDKSTKFVKNNSPDLDFIITVSDDCQTLAATLENEVDTEITNTIQWLTQQISLNVVNSAGSLEALQLGQSIRNLQDFQNKRSLVSDMMDHLSSSGHPSTELQDASTSPFLGLEITADFSRLDTIRTFLRYLRAYHLTDNEMLLTNWIQPFNETLAYIDAEINNFNNILESAGSVFQTLVSGLKDQYTPAVEQKDDSELPALSEQLEKDTTTLMQMVESLLAAKNFETYADVLLAGLNKLNVQVSEELIGLLEKNSVAATIEAGLEETPLQLVENSGLFDPKVLIAQFQLLLQRGQTLLANMAIKIQDQRFAVKYDEVVAEVNLVKQQ